jgi:hypothetical protein
MRKAWTVSWSALLAVGAISLPLLASTASTVAASPRTRPPIGKQLAELEGSGTVAGADFGMSVAISGTTLVAENEHTLYVFTKTATGWKQAAEWTDSDTFDFSLSVAISGTTLVVSGYGPVVYVFTKTATGWKQAAGLQGSGTGAEIGFGGRVAISGATVVVGAPGFAKDAGRAYVFTKTATGWKQAAELQGGSDTVAGGYDFGTSVAISGTTVVVGTDSEADDGVESGGPLYVFTKTAGRWKQAVELRGNFGRSVAISGTTLVVGDPVDVVDGQAYVFTKTATGWKQAAELQGSDTYYGDKFGYSVGISGATVVVGDYQAGSHGTGGRAYMFTKTATGWKQAAELKGSDTTAGDEFGYSVDISGTTVVVGAPCHARLVGGAYVFEA